ncbi:ABC transporter substrate-binding protein [Kiloniella sp. EL199]|uniref:substrate-binding periplasmic protein n=1 Tax=Kiloniella sp. EL199 TaxID=2107581 RepID=UPI000EA357E3|nr:transporter substrate-binding domain-containing protein [Kiloniella sp. EL199]
MNHKISLASVSAYGAKLVIITSFLISLSKATAWAENPSFVLCTENQSYPPYFIGEQDTFPEKKPGILVEIIDASLKKAGFSAEFIRRPWKRCLKLLEQNKIDGIFASIHLKEREFIGRYPYLPVRVSISNKPDPDRRLRRVTYSLFKKKGSDFDWDGENFSNMRHSIGASTDYVIVKKLKEEHSIMANTRHLPTKGLQHVAAGRLDAYIVESTIGNNLIKKLGLEGKLAEVKHPFARYDWYMMISHKFYNTDPHLADEIWNNVGQYRQQNIQRLIQHYSNSP